ncbi:MAG TPA: DNA polymerase III subunit delta' [Geobacterales bacterium]|nr:DNA polymerase III subunit delta' [Geobacterales bacterium]
MPFSAIIGHERIKELLQRAISHDRRGHAYLFHGPQGCGKRKTADAFIEAVFCRNRDERGGCGSCASCVRLATGQHPDLTLLAPDGAFIKIDQVRELQRRIALRPYEAPVKGCIIEDAHRPHAAAANALLKTLEEPPGQALIILLATDVEGIMPTILSRCQQLRFSPLPTTLVTEWLVSQGGTIEEARLIAPMAGGSLGRALEMRGEEILSGRGELLRRLLPLSSSRPNELFGIAEELGKEREQSMQLLDLLLSYYRDVLLVQNGQGEMSNPGLQQELTQEVNRSSLADTLRRLDYILQTRQAMDRNANPRLALEVLFMRLEHVGQPRRSAA